MAKDIRLSRWAFLRVLTSLPTLAILTGTVFGGCGYDKVSIAELEDMARDGESMSDLNFYSANLTGADLSNANLHKANLTGANLTDAVLGNADLTRAYLTDANLLLADLRYADLSGAILRGADLPSADLRGADLSLADLSGADLRHAILRRADLRNANIDAIIWQAHRPVLSQPDRSQPDRGWERRAVLSISSANIWDIKNAPDGFKKWALENGAVEIESEEEWDKYLEKLEKQ